MNEQERQGENLKRKIGYILIGVFVSLILLVCWLIVFLSLYYAEEIPQAKETFCQKQGYVGYSDSAFIFEGSKMAIECVDSVGKKEIFYIRSSTICVKKNKWGECMKREWLYVRG